MDNTTFKKTELISLVLFYAFILFITQYGNVAVEVIDWDESTFILMAASVLDGNLPYVKEFDNKPPLMFLILAAAMAVFGENLDTVRAVGDVSLLISSTCVYIISRRWFEKLPSFFSGLLIVSVHALPFASFTSTMLPSAALLLIALIGILNSGNSFWWAAMSGLCISLATLIRSNLGIVAIVFGVFYFVELLRNISDRSRFKAFLVYVCIGLAPPAIITFVYWYHGELPLLLMSVVELPFAYSTDQNSVFYSVAWHGWHWLEMMMDYPIIFGIYSFFLIVAVVIAAKKILQKSNSDEAIRRDYFLVYLMIFSVCVSVAVTGSAYTMYWLQFIPLFAVFFGELYYHRNYGRQIAGIMTALCLLSAITLTIVPTFKRVTDEKYLSDIQFVRNAANRLKEVRTDSDKIWTLEYQLINWYLGTPSISRIAHPDILFRPVLVKALTEFGYIRSNELELIYESKPDFLVMSTADRIWYMNDEQSMEFVTFKELYYKKLFSEGKIQIYQLK